MDSFSAPAIVALAVGLIGLAACAAAMAQVLPSPGWLDWFRRREREQLPPARLETGLEAGRRRVVTGAPAADRLGDRVAPARRPALRPDVLRRERERLTAEESRRIVERLADEDPARLAGVVGALLALDHEQQQQQQHERPTGRRKGTT